MKIEGEKDDSDDNDIPEDEADNLTVQKVAQSKPLKRQEETKFVPKK